MERRKASMRWSGTLLKRYADRQGCLTDWLKGWMNEWMNVSCQVGWIWAIFGRGRTKVFSLPTHTNCINFKPYVSKVKKTRIWLRCLRMFLFVKLSLISQDFLTKLLLHKNTDFRNILAFHVEHFTGMQECVLGC